jgi:hypothetical protein
MRETLKSLQSKIVHAAKRKDETLRRQFAHRVLVFLMATRGAPERRLSSIDTVCRPATPIEGSRD